MEKNIFLKKKSGNFMATKLDILHEKKIDKKIEFIYLWRKNNRVVISTQIPILRIISGQIAFVQHLLGCSFQKLIKRVKIIVTSLLMNNSGFLQKVIVDVASHGVSFKVKVDVHVLAKSRWVVVAVGFSVAKRFQNVIGL